MPTLGGVARVSVTLARDDSTPDPSSIAPTPSSSSSRLASALVRYPYLADGGEVIKLIGRPDEEVARILEVPLGDVKSADGAGVASYVARNVIMTSERRDRYKDIVRASGVDISDFVRNPVLQWSHGFSTAPNPSLGRVANIVATKTDKGDMALAGDFIFHSSTLALEIAQLWAGKFLRAGSIGFLPNNLASIRIIGPDGEPVDANPEDFYGSMPDGYGYEFLACSLLEHSVCPVPANPDALGRMRSMPETARTLGLSHKTHFGGPFYGRATFHSRACPGGHCPGCSDKEEDEEDYDETKSGRAAILAGISRDLAAIGSARSPGPIRWNKSLSEAFDVAAVPLEPSSTEIDLAAKFLGVRVASVAHTHTEVPSVRMGSFLCALDKSLKDRVFATIATRNLINWKDGRECPPKYEAVQLNGRLSQRFLIEGMRFYRSAEEMPLVMRFEPTWFGLHISIYARESDFEAAESMIDATWDYARGEGNFLRGESFSLSGEFLAPTSETWGSIFLGNRNQSSLERSAKVINEKGASAPSRGMVLMGPPGNGKTLACRILRNEADATFIWASARDFYYLGGFGGLTSAFAMARELAPSILCMEDCEGWIAQYADMLKAEMDGVAKFNGVFTALSTNHPDMLPKALIDRPGRFDDILRFDNPSEDVRRKMLESWLPSLDAEAVTAAAKSSDGFSGAYVHELAKYAQMIAAQDGLDLAEAVTKALEKIAEQKKLIEDVAATDGRYRRHVAGLVGRGSLNGPTKGAGDQWRAKNTGGGIAEAARVLKETSLETCPECATAVPFYRPEKRFVTHRTLENEPCRGVVLPSTPSGKTLKALLDERRREGKVLSRLTVKSLSTATDKIRAGAAEIDALVASATKVKDVTDEGSSLESEAVETEASSADDSRSVSTTGEPSPELAVAMATLNAAMQVARRAARSN